MNEVAPPETVSPGACFLGAFRLPSPSSAATNWSGFCQSVVIRPVQPKKTKRHPRRPHPCAVPCGTASSTGHTCEVGRGLSLLGVHATHVCVETIHISYN
jgi:hypothetical protein